jgi:hypothetical protein
MNQITILISIIFCSFNLYSQEDCYISPEQQADLEGPTEESEVPCFNINYVMENCTPIYINVNVHFFLDDNCQGNLAFGAGQGGNLNLSPQNAFDLGEEIVNTANNFITDIADNQQWNQEYNGATFSEPQCMPVQYVLNGTYIHCNTDFQNNDNQLASTYAVNEGNEINIFVSNIDFPGIGTGPNGFATNNIYLENFNGGLFNHEMGHVFSLQHTFNGHDNCDDLWNDSWKWDNNCDGIYDLYGKSCWSTDNTADNPATPQTDNSNACDPNIFCHVHPCCEWGEQNNNIMTYSAWAGNGDYAAFTSCQVLEMLKLIADKKCGFIEDIGGCPPPKAFIGTVPLPANTTECQSCFYFNSSFNESGYEMEIKNSNGGRVTYTGDVFTTAGKFCITPRYDKWGNAYWPNGMQSGEEYSLTLTVFNDCGDQDEMTFSFILPPLCNSQAPGPIKISLESISPNPSTGLITVKYTTNVNGQLKVYGRNLNSGQDYGLLRNQEEIAGINQEFSLDISTWTTGINTLILEYDGDIIVENVIKN